MSARQQGFAQPLLPQVNLLPPEVRAARGLRVVKRWLAAALVLVVLALVAVTGLSFLNVGRAEEALADAQDETVRLKAEEARYAEVPAVLEALSKTKEARAIGMSTEIQWKPYLDAITAVLPADVSFKTISLTSATPMQSPPLPSNPLQKPSIGTLMFTGRTSTLPDTSAWIDALNSVPGFSDAWVTTAKVAAEDATIYYDVTSNVMITDAAYALRFAAVEETS